MNCLYRWLAAAGVIAVGLILCRLFPNYEHFITYGYGMIVGKLVL